MRHLLSLLSLLLLALPPAARGGPYDQGDGTAYFPSLIDGVTVRYQLSRYDLAAQQWLAPLPMPSWVTPFVTDDAIYVRYGPSFFASTPYTVARYTKAGELVWQRVFDEPVGRPIVDGGIVFVGGRVLRVLDAGTGADVNQIDHRLWVSAIDTSRKRLYGFDEVIQAFDYAADGTLSAPSRAIPRHTSNADGVACLLDGGRVVGGSGGVFAADDLAWLENLNGLNVYQVVRVGDGYAAMHYGEIVRYDADLRPTGRFPLELYGTVGYGLFSHGEDVFLLYDPDGFRMKRIRPSDFAPYGPGAPIDPASRPQLGNPDAIAFDGADVVFLLASELRSVFRWSLSEARWLETFPLVAEPREMLYQPEARRLVFTHAWGFETIDVDSGGRATLDLPYDSCGMAAAGEHLIACERVEEASRLASIGPDGTRAEGPVLGFQYHELAAGWDPASRRLYVRAVPGYEALQVMELSAEGAFGPVASFPADTTKPLWTRFHLPQGELALFNGLLVGQPAGDPVAPLATAGASSATHVGALVALRFDRIASYGPDLQENASAPMAGYAGAVFPIGDRVLAVRSVPGSSTPNVRIFDPLDLDEDGVPLAGDSFPSDPLEWSDRDGDGRGDNGDAFPDDPTERDDRDGDGVGDFSDAFPDDPAEQVDTDRDGVGDNADAFPLDPFESADADRDGVPDRLDAYPIGSSLFGAALEGRQRLSVIRVGAAGTPLPPMTLGVTDDGRFSLCAEGECLYGTHAAADARGRRFVLVPQEDWLEGARGEVERAIDSALSRALNRSVEVAVSMPPTDANLTLKLDRKRAAARLVVKMPYSATVSGAPARYRRLRGAWVWRFRGALAAE